MPIDAPERKVLERLATYRPGEVRELNGSDAQRERAWTKCRDLGRRGYLRTSEWARRGFERVRGRFVWITGAGRERLGRG